MGGGREADECDGAPERVAFEAKTIGTTASAHTSIAVFRPALTLQPRLSKVDDSQPPPMLPTSAIRKMVTSGGPICSG